MNRLADLRAEADDGTAAAKVAAGILADTQTQILFRQPADQIAELTQLLGLSSHEAQLLPTLSQGHALWRVGDIRAVVRHRLGGTERAMCDTDQNMRINE